MVLKCSKSRQNVQHGPLGKRRNSKTHLWPYDKSQSTVFLEKTKGQKLQKHLKGQEICLQRHRSFDHHLQQHLVTPNPLQLLHSPWRVGQCYCLSRTRPWSGWSIVCCLAQVVMEGWFDDEIIWNLGKCVQFKFFFERMVPISSKWFSKNWTITKLNVEVEEHLYRVLKIHLHAHFSFPPAATCCTLPWSISRQGGW